MTMIGGKSLIELRIMREDEVRIAMENWPKSKLLIAYKYLRACGMSMEFVDQKINAALTTESKEGSSRT